MKVGRKYNKSLPFQVDYRKFVSEARCSSSKIYLGLHRSEIIEQEGWLDKLFLSSSWMAAWVHYCDGSQLDTDEWDFGKILAFSQFLKTLILSFWGSGRLNLIQQLAIFILMGELFDFKCPIEERRWTHL